MLTAKVFERVNTERQGVQKYELKVTGEPVYRPNSENSGIEIPEFSYREP